MNEELLKLAAECEGKLGAFREIMKQPEIADASVSDVFERLVFEVEADLAAVRRVIALMEKKSASGAAIDVPKSVVELVEKYLTVQSGMFTVKQVTHQIRGVQPDVTESAVAQALRRMEGRLVTVVKKGVGPHPTYFQRIGKKISGTGMAGEEPGKQ